MIYISHRGNLDGKNISKENHPNYIEKALNLGYNVEIDLWFINNKLVLGHDQPQYNLPQELLISPAIWIHCKNSDCLFYLLQIQNEYHNLHFFWHEKDKYTLTSKSIGWAYPGSSLNKKTVCVLPEISFYSKQELLNSYGICSDYIKEYRYD